MNSIYDTTLGILSKHFSQCQTIIEAKQASQDELLKLLQDNPDSENDIRLAILHFYHQKGLSSFVRYDKHQLQIITRIKNHTHNIYIQKICEFLRKHKSTLYIQQPQKSDFDELFAFIDSTFDSQTQSTKRDMIKTALRSVFGIKARDGLFFKNGNVTLKKFDQKIVQINSEIRQISAKMHINVLNNEDIHLIEKALQSVNIQSIIMQNTIQILERDIDLGSIDNVLFNQRFLFFSIQKLRLFLEELPLGGVDSLAKSMYCMGLAQQYAWVMFEIVAKELLELCAKNNAHAIAFLEFYNGGSIALGERVYTKPPIIDKNGNLYTLGLIQEILHNKSIVEVDIQTMQTQVDTLEEQIYTLTNQLKQDELKLKDYEHKIQAYKEELEAKNKELRLLVDKKSPKKEVDSLSKKINALIVEKSQLITDEEKIQKNQASLDKQHMSLLLSQQEVQTKISYALKTHKQQFLQYDLLLRALGNALERGKEIV